jgi:hypothetical protein
MKNFENILKQTGQRYFNRNGERNEKTKLINIWLLGDIAIGQLSKCNTKIRRIRYVRQKSLA